MHEGFAICNGLAHVGSASGVEASAADEVLFSSAAAAACNSSFFAALNCRIRSRAAAAAFAGV